MSDPAGTVPVMGLERIDLGEQADVDVQRTWGYGDPAVATHRTVGLGVCARGWFVTKTVRSGTLAWLAPDERTACERVQQWIRAGGWAEVSCAARS